MLQILILEKIRRGNSSVLLFLLYLATIGEADDSSGRLEVDRLFWNWLRNFFIQKYKVFRLEK